jgi:predicted nucleotidyltransferase
MKKIILGIFVLSSSSVFAENIRTISYTASRSSCANATTVAVNKCLIGDYWGAVRRGDVRKLNVEVASEKQIYDNLCEVTINCIFRFN